MKVFNNNLPFSAHMLQRHRIACKVNLESSLLTSSSIPSNKVDFVKWILLDSRKIMDLELPIFSGIDLKKQKHYCLKLTV